MTKHRRPSVFHRLRKFYARFMLCRHGAHASSRGRAKMVEGEWRSVCKFCGIPMRRLSKRKWEVLD